MHDITFLKGMRKKGPITDQRNLNRNDNKMQPGILDELLEQQKMLIGKLVKSKVWI